MMSGLRFLDANFCSQLCQTLLHSLWQVAVLALVAWVIERVLSRRFPEAAYVCSCGMLLLALVLLPVTFHALSPAVSVESPAKTNSQTMPVVTLTPTAVSDQNPEIDLSAVPAIADLPSHSEAVELRVHEHAESTLHTSQSSTPFDWNRLTPWVVGVYLIGVMWMLVRLVNSIRQATHLAKQGEVVTTGPLHETLQKLAQQWSMKVLPRLAVAKECVMPKVVGILKPTILLPASALTGLSEGELEIILLHELAHVRRHDLWMNLVQRLAEVVLFFNPALWWLSHRISTQREYCCDEMACRTMSHMHSDNTSVPRTRYALTLLRIVEMMQGQPANESLTTLAMSNRAPSELRRRVGRLFGESVHQPISPSRGGIVFVVTGIMLMMCTALWTPDVKSEVVNQSNDNAKLLKQLSEECHIVMPPFVREEQDSEDNNIHLLGITNPALNTLSKMKDVEVLRLVGSDLREMDFHKVGELTSLKKLFISDCLFLPHQMEALKSLPNLEVLELTFTILGQSEEWRLAQLGDLSEAEQQQAKSLRGRINHVPPVIQSALLTDRAMPYLKDLRKLKSLELFNTFVSPAGFAHLKNLSELETLNIDLCGATPEAVQPLLGMKKLKSLRYFNVDNAIVEQLAKIQSLEELDVRAEDVTDAGAVHLAKLTNLKELDVNGIQISDVGLLELAKLPKLEELSMKHGAFSENASKKFQEAYPNVKLPQRITWGDVVLVQKLTTGSRVTIGKTTFTGIIVDESGEPITVEGLMGYDCRMSSSRGASGNAGQYKGEFSAELPAGEVTLLNEVPGYAPTPLGPFTTKNGETVSDLKFVMTRGVDQRIKVVDPDGNAISEATVISHPEFFGKTDGAVYPKTTDENGEYLYQHLAKTRYAFNVTAPGFEPLRSEPLDLKLGEVLTLPMTRSQPTTGIVLNPDGTPAAGAKLRAQWEHGKRSVGFSDSDPGGWWGKVFATTNESGEFTLNQLTTGSNYMFIIQAEDGNRLIDRSLRAGQKNITIQLLPRRDLLVFVHGDLSQLPKRRGKPYVNLRQRCKTKTSDGGTHGDLFGQTVFIEPNKTGGSARFSGLAIDPENDDQKIEVYTSFSNKQIIPIKDWGDTVVEFDLTPAKPTAVEEELKVPDQKATLSGKIVLEDGTPSPVKGRMSIRTLGEKHGELGLRNPATDEFRFQTHAGEVCILFHTEEYAFVVLGPINVSPGEIKDDLKIVLKPGFSQLIKVVNEDGEPITNAKLTEFPTWDNKGTQSVAPTLLTNANGECIQKNVGEVPYRYTVSADGYEYLKTEPFTLKQGEPVQLTMTRSLPTAGVVLNEDSTPAIGAKLRWKSEVSRNGDVSSGGVRYVGGQWGKPVAVTNESGEFRFNTLKSSTKNAFLIEGENGTRIFSDELIAGKDDLSLNLPKRLDLKVTIHGDIANLHKPNRHAAVRIRQDIRMETEFNVASMETFWEDLPITETQTGGSATFEGLVIDPKATKPQMVEVYLNNDYSTKQIVEINAEGETVVEFNLSQAKPQVGVLKINDQVSKLSMKVQGSHSLETAYRILSVEGFDNEILTVKTESPHRLRLHALKVGTTSIHVIDENASVMTVDVVVKADAVLQIPGQKNADIDTRLVNDKVKAANGTVQSDKSIKLWKTQLIDGMTDKRLSDIKVQVKGAVAGKKEPQLMTLVSGKDGMIEIPWSIFTHTTFEVVTPGWFVPGYGYVQDFRGLGLKGPSDIGTSLPSSIKLWRGQHVSGRLLYPDKTPAVGVRLSVGAYLTNTEWKKRLGMDLTRYSFDHGNWPNWSRQLTTNDDGTFTTTVPPENSRSWVRVGTTQLGFGSISLQGMDPDGAGAALAKCVPFEYQVGGHNSPPLNIASPHLERDEGYLHLGDLHLKRGVTVTGRVLDEHGNGLEGVRLTTTGAHGPHSGRSAVSGKNGEFEFLPITPGGLTIRPDARIRDTEGKVISRDVQAVFVDESFSIPESDKPIEITVKAVPTHAWEFEWIDRRKEKGPVSFYGRFILNGYHPTKEGQTFWRGETHLVERDGKQYLIVKAPRKLINPAITLSSDRVVTASYTDNSGVDHGPGRIELGEFDKTITRTIFGDEPKEKGVE